MCDSVRLLYLLTYMRDKEARAFTFHAPSAARAIGEPWGKNTDAYAQLRLRTRKSALVTSLFIFSCRGTASSVFSLLSLDHSIFANAGGGGGALTAAGAGAASAAGAGLPNWTPTQRERRVSAHLWSEPLQVHRTRRCHCYCCDWRGGILSHRGPGLRLP